MANRNKNVNIEEAKEHKLQSKKSYQSKKQKKYKHYFDDDFSGFEKLKKRK
jgi:hypothetical protein